MENKSMKNSRIAIVTGGCSGIGLAISKNMVRDGYITCIMGRRREGEVQEALHELRSGGEVLYFQGSISDADRRKAFIDAVIHRYGKIDVLVNNAGVAPKARMDILETSEDNFNYVVDNNLKGTMFFTQCVANEMRKQKRDAEGQQGIIVNISSFSAVVSSPNRAEYCVSKAGISMLTKLYADRLIEDNIFVYEVQPGIIRTNMTQCVIEKYDKLIFDEHGNFPIHRWGIPEDVANVVSTLVNGNLTYTTGQVIYCDGGYMNVRSI